MAPLRSVLLIAGCSSGIGAALAQETRRLDVLVDNAGYGRCGAVPDLSTDALRRQFDTNVTARLPRVAIILMMAALAIFALAGCTTSRNYRMAKDDTPPAVPLNFIAAVPALELRLVAVIVNQGPGSWKQHALWDEYIVSLTNRDSGPLTGESVELVDFLGASLEPGIEPWTLEKLSEANWEQYARVGRFVLGAGAAAGAMEVAAIGYGLAGGGSAGIFFIMPALLVANVAVVAVMDHQNKEKVQKEFARRQLRLPLDLAPGTAILGSLFLPMVPRPQRLIFRGKAGEAPLELVLDLKPLAGLHVDPAAQ